MAQGAEAAGCKSLSAKRQARRDWALLQGEGSSQQTSSDGSLVLAARGAAGDSDKEWGLDVIRCGKTTEMDGVRSQKRSDASQRANTRARNAGAGDQPNRKCCRSKATDQSVLDGNPPSFQQWHRPARKPPRWGKTEQKSRTKIFCFSSRLAKRWPERSCSSPCADCAMALIGLGGAVQAPNRTRGPAAGRGNPIEHA